MLLIPLLGLSITFEVKIHVCTNIISQPEFNKEMNSIYKESSTFHIKEGKILLNNGTCKRITHGVDDIRCKRILNKVVSNLP